MAGALVTGGAGFIGSHLLQALLARGQRVVCLDNFDPFYPRACKERNLAEVGASPALTLVEGDICDAALVGQLMAEHQPEVVYHLAAKAGVRPSLVAPLDYIETNVSGTVNLLKAATEAGVRRFVFASSSSVYGAGNTLPFSEDQDVLRPLSPYAASKVAAEALCHTYHHLHGLPVVLLRFFTVYGPRQRPDLAINKFVRLMLGNESIPVFGDGSSSRDYTFVGDIVRGLLLAAESELNYETINLGNSSPVSLGELIAAVEQAVGRPARIERLPEQAGDMPHTYANVAKAERLLGWRPEVSLAEGLAQFVEWHKRTAVA